MSKSKRRTHRGARSVLVAIVITVVCTVGLGVRVAYAGGGRTYELDDILQKNVGLTICPQSQFGTYPRYTFASKKAITKAKSSNPKVVEAKAVSLSDGTTYLDLKVHKTGKAKVTFKLGNKRKSIQVTVSKYKNPFKKLVVGKKNYASRFKRESRRYMGLKLGTYITGKVSVVPAKNWKVKRIEAYIPGKMFRKVKNDGKLPSGTTNVTVFMQNTRTKVWQPILLFPTK